MYALHHVLHHMGASQVGWNVVTTQLEPQPRLAHPACAAALAVICAWWHLYMHHYTLYNICYILHYVHMYTTFFTTLFSGEISLYKCLHTAFVHPTFTWLFLCFTWIPNCDPKLQLTHHGSIPSCVWIPTCGPKFQLTNHDSPSFVWIPTYN